VQLTDALSKAQGKRGPVYAEPRRAFLENGECAGGRAGKVGGLARLLKVFLALSRLEHGFRQHARRRRMGRRPIPFSQYCYPLLRFTRENNFEYKYLDWPAGAGAATARRLHPARK
jgi:hypothetical protein